MIKCNYSLKNPSLSELKFKYLEYNLLIRSALLKAIDDKTYLLFFLSFQCF